MGQLWSSHGVQTLKRFAVLGGCSYYDVVGVKLFQRSATNPPETMLQLTSMIDRVMHEAGVHPRLWNTGTTYTIPLQGPLNETKAANYAVCLFLAGLYARNVSLERMYFLQLRRHQDSDRPAGGRRYHDTGRAGRRTIAAVARTRPEPFLRPRDQNRPPRQRLGMQVHPRRTQPDT
jgi:hypothetical protein